MLTVKEILAELEAARDARIELVSGGRPRLVATEGGNPRYLADAPMAEEELMQVCRGLGAGRRVDGLDEAPAAWTYRTHFAVLKVSAVVNEGTMAVLVHRADAKPLPRATPERRRTTTAPRPPRSEGRTRRASSGSTRGVADHARSALTQRLPRVPIGRVGGRPSDPPERARERTTAPIEPPRAPDPPVLTAREGREGRGRGEAERTPSKRPQPDTARPPQRRAETVRSLVVPVGRRPLAERKRQARPASGDALDRVLAEAREVGATDVVVLPNGTVSLRVPGRRLRTRTEHDARLVAEACLDAGPAHARRRFRERGTALFGLERPGGPVRVRATRTTSGTAVDLHVLLAGPFDLTSLGAHRAVDDLTSMTDGLVLFVGLPCSGKTTAALAFAARTAARLSTVAEVVAHPCEYPALATSGAMLVREVGVHVSTVASGVQSAMRSRRDVIVAPIGDARSARALLAAADAGHLVIATIAADSAESALRAIPVLFDDEEARWAERVLAANLRAAVETALVRHSQAAANVVAFGVVSIDEARRTGVRRGKVSAILVPDDGRGTASLLRNLARLVQAGAVTAAEACRAARDADLLMELCDELPPSSSASRSRGSGGPPR